MGKKFKKTFVLQFFLEVAGGVACLASAYLLGRALADDAAATVAALGTHVDDPVRHLDDVHVVLDDEDGVALVDELVEHAHQHLDVLEVEARGRLVEHVERLARVALGQFGGQLHALRLASADGGGGLTEGQIA